MKAFYAELSGLYSGYNLDLESNRGRRNILMSAPMERFLCEALSESHLRVWNDGRTGKADILIEFSDGPEKEIECKLTSPHESSGTISFQTDFETLKKKGSLDFVYIIADPSFSKFCAIHFKDLTIEDFRSVSPGARGKVQMYKYKGMKKATVLVGKAINLNEKTVFNLKKKKDFHNSDFEKKHELLCIEKQSLRPTQIYDANMLEGKIQAWKEKWKTAINNIDERINITKERNARYSFEFESLEIKNETTSNIS